MASKAGNGVNRAPAGISGDVSPKYRDSVYVFGLLYPLPAWACVNVTSATLCSSPPRKGPHNCYQFIIRLPSPHPPSLPRHHKFRVRPINKFMATSPGLSTIYLSLCSPSICFSGLHDRADQHCSLSRGFSARPWLLQWVFLPRLFGNLHLLSCCCLAGTVLRRTLRKRLLTLLYAPDVRT